MRLILAVFIAVSAFAQPAVNPYPPASHLVPGSSSSSGSGTVTSIATGNCLSGGPVTTTGTISLGTSINPQTSTYQVLAADFSLCKTITVASGTFTITLVASGSQPSNGTYINIVNYGSGVVTVARSGQNINGGTSSLTLAAASATAPTSAQIWSDGTNYFADVTTAGALPAGCPGAASVQSYATASTLGCVDGVTINSNSDYLLGSIDVARTFDLSTFATALDLNTTIFFAADHMSTNNQLMFYSGVNIADGSGSDGGSIDATYNFVANYNNRAGKTLALIVANWNEVDNYGTIVINKAAANLNEFNVGGGAGVISELYGVWNRAPDGGTAPTTFYGFYNDDLSGLSITNPYYSWFDSRGVRRVKEDSTFDSVGQAIEALYNPLFTKYTPGASNYERIILGEWNGNVGEIGTEAGGTGTLRPLLLLGNNVSLGDSNVTAYPVAHPAAFGMTGLQLGLPEPDLSCCDGPTNTLVQTISGANLQQNVINYNGSGSSPNEITYYAAHGTKASPTNLSSGDQVMNHDYIAWVDDAWKYVGEYLVVYNSTYQAFGFDSFSGPGEFWIQGRETGLARPSNGVVEVNNGVPVASGGSLGVIQVNSATLVSALSTGTAFASLATPTNGTTTYCPDCTVTSGIDDTCVGSGSGAWAERINGAWKCKI